MPIFGLSQTWPVRQSQFTNDPSRTVLPMNRQLASPRFETRMCRSCPRGDPRGFRVQQTLGYPAACPLTGETLSGIEKMDTGQGQEWGFQCRWVDRLPCFVSEKQILCSALLSLWHYVVHRALTFVWRVAIEEDGVIHPINQLLPRNGYVLCSESGLPVATVAVAECIFGPENDKVQPRAVYNRGVILVNVVTSNSKWQLRPFWCM